MKHYFSIFFFLVLIVYLVSGSAYAQPASVWLGAHAGADIGTISTAPAPSDGETITSKNGIAIGAEGDYWLSDNIGICVQLAYVQKGATDNLDGESFSLAFWYLQMPVLLKATFGSGPVKPFFFAGPEIGFKLSAKESGKFEGRDTTADLPDSVITKLNIGIFLGAGITYILNPETMLFLQAGYDYGLSNIYSQFGNSPGGEDKIFTRDIRASLGILFRIE